MILEGAAHFFFVFATKSHLLQNHKSNMLLTSTRQRKATLRQPINLNINMNNKVEHVSMLFYNAYNSSDNHTDELTYDDANYRIIYLTLRCLQGLLTIFVNILNIISILKFKKVRVQ